MKICPECKKENPDDAKFCEYCGYNFETIKPKQDLDQSQKEVKVDNYTNSTSLNPNIPLEKYKGKLNWGAFFLSFFWSIAHRAYLWAALSFFIGFIASLILLFIGNEVALQNRKFESEQEFVEVEKAWSKWGLIIFIVSIVIVILSIAIPLLFVLKNR